MRLLLDTHAFLWFVLNDPALVTNLPFHHKDPFDRLLIAQSLTEAIPIVSADSTLNAYGVTRLW
jgi:PIN domain nuclease of toxin-antitoxin system